MNSSKMTLIDVPFTEDELKSKYDERFYRMWKFYLVGGSGMARSRDTQVWQIVYSKKGVLGGYNAIR